MINNNKFDYFAVLVIGEDPEAQIAKFDEMIDVEPYVLYQYKDRSKIRKLQIEIYKNYLKTVNNLQERNLVIDKINELKKTSDEQYFLSLSELHQLDENKNIITSDNPDGKWLTCELGGRMYSDYLKDLTGKSITSGKKNEIDWSEIHLYKDIVNKYKRTWELCVEGVKSETPTDSLIINNMRHLTDYFKNFKNKEEYIKYNSSFFTNAVILNGKWIDMEDFDYSDWIINYFNNYISKLKNDELISIFECTK